MKIITDFKNAHQKSADEHLSAQFYFSYTRYGVSDEVAEKDNIRKWALLYPIVETVRLVLSRISEVFGDYKEEEFKDWDDNMFIPVRRTFQYFFLDSPESVADSIASYLDAVKESTPRIAISQVGKVKHIDISPVILAESIWLKSIYSDELSDSANNKLNLWLDNLCNTTSWNIRKHWTTKTINREIKVGADMWKMKSKDITTTQIRFSKVTW
jgi:hypothetical protein